MVFIYSVHVHKNQRKTCPNATLFCTNLTHPIAVITIQWYGNAYGPMDVDKYGHDLITHSFHYTLSGGYTVLRVKHFSILEWNSSHLITFFLRHLVGLLFLAVSLGQNIHGDTEAFP
jgi:hypothetical protein